MTTGVVLGRSAALEPWWRMRPSDDGREILAEGSPDGLRWTPFATDPVAPPAQIRLEIGIGAFGDEPDGKPRTGRVASVDLCP